MIVDASVWVASFLEVDRHHKIARTCVTALLERESRLAIPVLAWPEVAGAVARRTGVAENGRNAVNAIRALRWIESVSIDPLLAETATKIASDLKLRGADAFYVALAVARKEPLITLDTEMLERAREVAEVLTPEQWLQKN